MPDKKSGIYFTVVLPYCGDQDAIHKSIASINSQQFKNFSVLCVVPHSHDDRFHADAAIANAGFLIRKKAIAYGDANISRVEGVAAVESDWVCFINPGDEWLPHHLSVFVEAIKHNADTLALYSQNLLTGFSAIGRLRKENNKIQLNLLKPSELPVATQCCIHSSALENIKFPWLKFPALGDVFFLRLVDVNHDFTRVNQLSCKCKNEIRKFSFVNIDAFILMSDYLIRNIFKDKTYRRFLLYSSYYWAVINLMAKFKLISASIYLWHFIKQYLILTTRFYKEEHGG